MKTLHKVSHSFRHVPKQLAEYLLAHKMLWKKKFARIRNGM